MNSFVSSYNENLTIKEMLTDFLTKIGSKEKLEEMYFLYNCHILNNNRYFSKTIKEIFKSQSMSTVKIQKLGEFRAGNK